MLVCVNIDFEQSHNVALASSLPGKNTTAAKIQARFRTVQLRSAPHGTVRSAKALKTQYNNNARHECMYPQLSRFSVLRDGNFSRGLQGWDVVSWGGTPTISAGVLKVSAVSGNNHFAIGQPLGRVIRGKSFTFRVRIKVQSKCCKSMRVSPPRWAHPDQETSSTYFDSLYHRNTRNVFPVDGNWHTMTYAFTAQVGRCSINSSVGYRPGYDRKNTPYKSSSCRTGYNESEFSFMQDNGWGCRTGHTGRPNNTCVGDTIFITNMTLVPLINKVESNKQ